MSTSAGDGDVVWLRSNFLATIQSSGRRRAPWGTTTLRIARIPREGTEARPLAVRRSRPGRDVRQCGWFFVLYRAGVAHPRKIVGLLPITGSDGHRMRSAAPAPWPFIGNYGKRVEIGHRPRDVVVSSHLAFGPYFGQRYHGGACPACSLAAKLQDRSP